MRALLVVTLFSILPNCVAVGSAGTAIRLPAKAGGSVGSSVF